MTRIIKWVVKSKSNDVSVKYKKIDIGFILGKEKNSNNN